MANEMARMRLAKRSPFLLVLKSARGRQTDLVLAMRVAHKSALLFGQSRGQRDAEFLNIEREVLNDEKRKIRNAILQRK